MREPAARGGGGAAVTVAVEAREGATDLLIKMFYSPKRGWERGARRRRLAADGDDATNERGGGLRVCAVVCAVPSLASLFYCFCFVLFGALGFCAGGALCCSCSML